MCGGEGTSSAGYNLFVLPDLFDEAQAFVLDKMEREVHPKFLRSRDGQQFLEALVTRDIDRRKKRRLVHHVSDSKFSCPKKEVISALKLSSLSAS